MNPTAKPTVSSLIVNNKRRLVYAFEDGRQAVEEYDLKTHEIISRKTKKPQTFKEAKWEYEIGEAERSEPVLLHALTAPIFIRKDTLEAFQWRIRNLPYPEPVYQFAVDHEKQEIVIRTTNKKYYKRFDIPDMKRINKKLNIQALTHTYGNDTLVVTYRKPEELLERELVMRKQFIKLNAKKPKEGDLECTNQ